IENCWAHNKLLFGRSEGASGGWRLSGCHQFSIILARNRTWSSTFVEARANSGTLRGRVDNIQYPDLESNQVLDLRTVACASATPSGQSKHEREDLNPVRLLWRQPSLPGEHSCYGSRPAGREPSHHSLSNSTFQ